MDGLSIINIDYTNSSLWSIQDYKEDAEKIKIGLISENQVDEKEAKAKEKKAIQEEKRIAMENGEVQKAIALDQLQKQNDAFIKEKEEKAKTEVEILKKQKEINERTNSLQSFFSLSSENEINNLTKTDKETAKKVIEFREYTEDLVSGKVSSTTFFEAVKEYASKENELEKALQNYQSLFGYEKEEDSNLSINSKKDKYDAKNPIETNTNNQNNNNKKTFIA